MLDKIEVELSMKQQTTLHVALVGATSGVLIVLAGCSGADEPASMDASFESPPIHDGGSGVLDASSPNAQTNGDAGVTVGDSGGEAGLPSTDPCSGDVRLSERASEIAAALDSIRSCVVIHGDLTLDTLYSNIEVINLPLLTRVDGNLTMDASAQVTALRLTALSEIGGDVLVSQNPVLEQIDLPSLVSVGGLLRLPDDPELVAVTLPMLRELGSMQFQRLPKLESLTLPNLEIAHGSVSVSVSVTLRDIDFSQLTTVDGNFSVFDNPQLVSLECPSLRTVKGGMYGVPFNVYGNAKLPMCQVDALLTGLVEFDGGTTIRDNGPSCP